MLTPKSRRSSLSVSLVVTFLNEAKSLPEFISSINHQILKPQELILIDGGSDDGSFNLAKQFVATGKIKVIVKRKKGNISVGRNYGVTLAKYKLIAFTDLGCLPDNDWLQELVKTYQQTSCPVVAGYYYGLAKSNLQRAMVPYSLVLPNRLKPSTFLPASRSMLMEKKLFLKLGGFDKKLAVSEDYDLAKRIELLAKNSNKKLIAFNQKAKVGWYPRSNLVHFIKMIYLQTLYDVQAKHIRPKVIILVLRYLLAVLFTVLIAIKVNYQISLLFAGLILLIYCLWAVAKNNAVVKNGWYYLPLLQIVSDLGVMIGFWHGLIKLRSSKLNLYNDIKRTEV